MTEYFETVSFDQEVPDFWSETDDVPEDDSQHASQRDLPNRAASPDTFEQDLSRDLSRWERKTLNRLADGKSARAAFTSETIPDEIHEWVVERLEARPLGPDAVRDLFRAARVRARLFLAPGEPQTRKSFGRLWKSRRIAAERAARG